MEIVNVKDIGVIENGLRDCSHIVNSFLFNANNNGKTLYFPKGYYFIKDGLFLDARNYIGMECDNEAVIYIDKSTTAITILNMGKNNENHNITINGFRIEGYTLFKYIKNVIRWYIVRPLSNIFND